MFHFLDNIISTGLAVGIVQLLIVVVQNFKPNKKTKAIQSLLRDRITAICLNALFVGTIDSFSHQNLLYLYDSYHNIHGNSYVDSLMERVKKEVKIID